LRGLNKEQREEKLGQIAIIKEMQKKLNESKNILEIIKRQKEAEIIRQKGERREEKQRERDDDDDRLCRESYQKNEKEREEREEQERVNKEWRKIEKMRIKEERRAEREWRRQEMQKRRREENRQKAMEERKCFVCGEFGHMASNCRNIEKEEPVLVSSNRFEVLKVRVMQKGEGSGKEMAKDRREILREEKAKRGVEVTKVEKKEKKEKMLREVMVKIGLKQEEDKERVVTELLLDSSVTELVMSKEFVRKNKFKRTKLERLVYVRNIDSTLNYAGLIVDIVEVEIFFKRYKKQTLIDVIRGQNWSVILDIPWLGRHNLEIDWKTREVKITRCLDECGKK